MYEWGELEKGPGNKILYRFILEQCELCCVENHQQKTQKWKWTKILRTDSVYLGFGRIQKEIVSRF